MSIAKILMICGAVLLLAGFTLHQFPTLLNWFGKLPGDVNIQNENSRFFMPVTSMILISIVLTILLNLIRR